LQLTPKGKFLRFFAFLLSAVAVLPALAHAQEAPYFVTYDHHLEEPGNLEFSPAVTLRVPRNGERFIFAPYAELEYGITARWTTELYIEGQSTNGDSAVFTGWRLENRFRPLKREHWINPILYFEFEDINEASRISKEVVGHSLDLGVRNDELSRTPAREIEGKLILSSTVKDWNISENFIFEKNLSQDEGVEFGYAFGAYRPLGTLASANKCRFCRENFTVGAELYGGLGSTQQFGFKETDSYIAPVVAWQFSDNVTFRFSPAIGLTHGSNPALFRFSTSYEVQNLRQKLYHLFGGKP
jgi:hypothetical protein